MKLQNVKMPNWVNVGRSVLRHNVHIFLFVTAALAIAAKSSVIRAEWFLTAFAWTAVAICVKVIFKGNFIARLMCPYVMHRRSIFGDIFKSAVGIVVVFFMGAQLYAYHQRAAIALLGAVLFVIMGIVALCFVKFGAEL